jgi:hypothetical protein
VLTATMIGCAANRGATIDRAYQAERANDANLLTITDGHQIDALCYCLGEFRELTAFAVSQRDNIAVGSTGEVVPKNVPDQLVVNGIVGDGAVVSSGPPRTDKNKYFGSLWPMQRREWLQLRPRDGSREYPTSASARGQWRLSRHRDETRWKEPMSATAA